VPNIHGKNSELAAANSAWVMPIGDVVRLLASFDRSPHPFLGMVSDPASLVFDSVVPGSAQGDPGITFLWSRQVLKKSGSPFLIRAAWHNGAVSGGSAFAMRRGDGFCLALGLNQDVPASFGPDGAGRGNTLQFTSDGLALNDLFNAIPTSVLDNLTLSDIDWKVDLGLDPW